MRTEKSSQSICFSIIFFFLQSICFAVAGEKLTARMRYWSFQAILRQEGGWFDSERNSSGILATRLAQDASQVQGVSFFFIEHK